MTPEQMAAGMAKLDIDSSDKKQNKVASSCDRENITMGTKIIH